MNYCQICKWSKNLIQCLQCDAFYCEDCMKWAHGLERLFAINPAECDGLQARNSTGALISKLRRPM